MNKEEITIKVHPKQRIEHASFQNHKLSQMDSKTMRSACKC